ncbi:UPF0716 protein FxsA [Nitratiruptor sp. YY08-26]|uniref:FxsA family protein n=1 Tax=unclassified Nitratiruptor TaxID=2624044 RepID=UPI001916C45A|nr:MULTISPECIES: FxsA family protein [unclassified Nitratiruptor]BCD62394.1 UPF0716 protein FxsA [Nitratiruptor sp. YY08-13]BCD66330.1 UPF0716 protein FxsA [Nitratiruptor sp. YY08-26]
MLYFLLYLFIETFVSVQIASVIGPFWTFVEIVASAVYGFWIIRNMHIQMMATMQALANGEITVEEFESMNLSMLVGAILLIIPGFFTDIIGMLLQFGVFSTFIAKKILKLKSKKKREDDNVIDVEIIEH